MTALLRSELRKTFSTKLWWALGIPVALVAIVVNVFGALFAGALAPGSPGDRPLPLLLFSLAYSLVLSNVFAAVAGVVWTAGEFRHRTITTTYLTVPGRAPVLLAKMTLSGLVGALYAGVTVVVGLVAGLVGRSDGTLPDTGSLIAVAGIGIAAGLLWGAFGAALGIVVGNQVGALLGLLLYLLLAEPFISMLLNRSDHRAVARITSYLPGNAGDVALYDLPARGLSGLGIGSAEIVETFAGVTDPPPWWVALVVLGAWTAAAGATAWVAGGRRDVT